MFFSLILIVVGAALFVSACGSSKYPTTYKVVPCRSALSVNHRAHTFAATLLALEERGWAYVDQDFEKTTIVARACMARGGECASMKFIATEGGTLMVTEAQESPVPDSMTDDVYRWMNFFKAAYGKFSCYTDDALREGVSRFGYRF
jgi:hypothetical protein